MRQKMPVNRITRGAVLATLALVLSLLESALPPLLPLPGMKLGLANIVTLFALYALGAGEAFVILTVRLILGAVFAGQITAFLYSFTGGMLAMLTMVLVKRTRCSIYGVSVSGAAAHAVGQILAASLLMQGPAPVVYLGPLLFVSLFTGSLSAFTVSLLLPNAAVRGAVMRGKA